MRPTFPLVLAFTTAACTAPESGALDTTTEDGLYTLAASIAPAPPEVGEAELFVRSDGVAITVDAFMVGMGHGLEEAPAVTPDGVGAWSVDLEFPMSGTWQVHFLVDGEDGLDAADWFVEVG